MFYTNFSVSMTERIEQNSYILKIYRKSCSPLTFTSDSTVRTQTDRELTQKMHKKYDIICKKKQKTSRVISISN